MVLLVAACGGDDAGPTLGGNEDADSSADAPDVVEEPSSTAPSTTATIPEGAVEIPDLQITVVEFGDQGFVELMNTGAGEAAVSGVLLCQSSTCTDLGTVVESGVIAAASSVQIDAAAVGGLSIDGGEAALYSENDMTNADAIFAYVQWGAGGSSSEVAAQAGIWPPGASITPDPQFGNIELFGDPADPESWG